MPSGSKISGPVVRADFNAVEAVVHYTRAAHRLGLWASERQLIERFFPDRHAPLLEAGCGAGRATLGLWDLGYRDLTAFDFADELVEQARDLAAQRGATGIRFFHADATKPAQLRALLPSAPPSTRRRDVPEILLNSRTPTAHRPPSTVLRPLPIVHRPLSIVHSMAPSSSSTA